MVLMMEKLVAAAPPISCRRQDPPSKAATWSRARRIPVEEHPKLAHHVTKIQAALQLMSRGPFADRKVKFPEL